MSSNGRGAVVDHEWFQTSAIGEQAERFFQETRTKHVEVKLTDSGASSETDDVRAIVVWLLKSIESGFSNNSNDDIGDVLRSMDPNSKVLQQSVAG